MMVISGRAFQDRKVCRFLEIKKEIDKKLFMTRYFKISIYVSIEQSLSYIICI